MRKYPTVSARLLPQLIGIVSIMALFQGVGASNFSPNEEIEVSIRAADASKSLFRLARKTRLSLVYRKSDVKGISTNSVEGTYTPEEALMALLEGTLLGAKKDAETGAFAIYRIEEFSPKLSQDQTSANLDDPTNENPNQHLDTVMNTKKTRLSKLFAGLLSAFAVTASSNAVAQDENQIDEDIYELSPFIVDTTDDVGYLASNTLAGSRLNASLSDIANSVSVFTPELIDDLGAVNEEDLLAYSSSVVIEASEQTNNVMGTGFVDNFFGFRIRGMVATRTRNFFESFIKADTYNTSRFDQASGPNSILFGVGGAGGIVNSSTKRAQIGSTFGSAQIRVDAGNYSGVRGTVDYNLAVNDKFAVRFNGVLEDGDGWRAYEFKDNKRAHLTATYRLFENTTVRVEYENGAMKDSNQRNFIARDNLSRWLNNGMPTVSNAQANPQTNIGIGRRGNAQRVSYVDNDGSFRNFQRTVFSVAEVSRDTLFDDDIAPYDALWEGPGSYQDADYNVIFASIETEPFENFFVELAYSNQDENQVTHDTNPEGFTLFAEPAETFRDGEVNPYAGHFYTETRWLRRIENWDVLDYRLTASYQLDTGNKWLGRHNIAALWSRSERNRDRRGDFLTMEGAPFNNNAEHGRNRIFFRHYVTDVGNGSDYYIPSWDSISSVSVVMNPGQNPVTYNAVWSPNSLGDDTRVNKAYQFSTQSFFWNDRIVATLGWRDDEVEDRSATATGPRNELGQKTLGDNVYQSKGAQNFSYGIVGKVTDWLSVLYNSSENFDIPGSSLFLIPDNSFQPLKSGVSEDWGVMLNLLDNRLFIRAAYYTNSSVDEARGFAVNSNVIDRNNRILDTLVADGVITDSQAESQRIFGSAWDLSDKKTDGWELSVTANPTNNWRVTMNMNAKETVETNMLKRTRSIMGDLLGTWGSFDQSIETEGEIDGRPRTIGDEIDQFNQWYEDTIAVEGTKSYGNRDLQFRLFTRYDFKDGFLKGSYAGGGIRYSGAPFVGILANGDEVFGEIDREVDLLFGYKTKVKWWGGKAQNLSLQLNITNLLQQNDYRTLRVESAGNVVRARVNTPTKVTFTGRLSF